MLFNFLGKAYYEINARENFHITNIKQSSTKPNNLALYFYALYYLFHFNCQWKQNIALPFPFCKQNFLFQNIYVVKRREVYVCIRIFEVSYFLSKKGKWSTSGCQVYLSYQWKKTKNAEHRDFSLKNKMYCKTF